jgi:hypothetical protein
LASVVEGTEATEHWAPRFGNPPLASAGLDGLAHNAYVIVITGPSYRSQDRRQ